MIGLLQRVSSAHVVVAGETIGAIDRGLLILLCAEKGDTEAIARKLLDKVLALRIFADDAGKMNRSVRDVCGGLLFVPQFTLAADTRGGTRPSFSAAAEPEHGRRLFDFTVATARTLHRPVRTGRFGADMQVSLTNDGPVTIWLRIEPVESSPPAP